MHLGKPTAGPLTPESCDSPTLRAPLPPTDCQETPEIRSALVEEQETTRHLGDRRKRRKTFGDLGRAAGFLL
jgi:hypothetical protein